MNESARTVYDEAANQVLNLLDLIQSRIGKNDPGADIHWGHVGDMARVAASLTEILDFLRGDK